MEVILKQDVQGLGYKNDLVSVKPGYGRNYLIPNGIALVATESNKKIVEQERQAHLRRESKEIADSQELAKMMANVSVSIAQKAGENDHLFGSVTAGDVVAAIKKAGGPNLDKRTVELPKAHIKSVGTHKIAVRLHPSVNVPVSLAVVAG